MIRCACCYPEGGFEHVALEKVFVIPESETQVQPLIHPLLGLLGSASFVQSAAALAVLEALHAGDARVASLGVAAAQALVARWPQGDGRP